jgi:hypothetical protein
MRKFLFGLIAVVLVIVFYLVYTELSYSPLDNTSLKKLFKQSVDLEKLCSIDFLGFNTKGEFFELYKYVTNEVEIDSLFTNVQVWESKELPKNTIIGKWKACPLDSLSSQLYEFTLTANDFDKRECSNTLNEALKNAGNYYSYIYVNELEQYFLLYIPKEKILYYLRRKGF